MKRLVRYRTIDRTQILFKTTTTTTTTTSTTAAATARTLRSFLDSSRRAGVHFISSRRDLFPVPANHEERRPIYSSSLMCSMFHFCF